MIDKVLRQGVTSALGVAEFLLSQSLEAVRMVNHALADSDTDPLGSDTAGAERLSAATPARTDHGRTPSWRPAELGDLDATSAVLRERSRPASGVLGTRTPPSGASSVVTETASAAGVSDAEATTEGRARRRPPRSAMRRRPGSPGVAGLVAADAGTAPGEPRASSLESRAGAKTSFTEGRPETGPPRETGDARQTRDAAEIRDPRQTDDAPETGYPRQTDDAPETGEPPSVTGPAPGPPQGGTAPARKRAPRKAAAKRTSKRPAKRAARPTATRPSEPGS